MADWFITIIERSRYNLWTIHANRGIYGEKPTGKDAVSVSIFDKKETGVIVSPVTTPLECLTTEALPISSTPVRKRDVAQG